MPPIYYINLASRPDRRAHMEAQFAALGLSAQRIEAVTPAELSASDVALYCNPERRGLLRQNELACTLSHEKAWQALLDSGHDRALVFEDDAQLSSLLPAFLQEAETIDVDLIRLETTGIALRVFPVLSTGASGIALRPFRSTPLGAAGYIIRAEAARRIIGHPGLRRRQVDLAIYSPFEEPGALLSRLLVDPALCRQLNSAEGKTEAVARSDVDVNHVVHAYAIAHPIRFRALKWSRGLKRGLRNAGDHFVQQSKGLRRRVIPFAE